MTPTPLSFRTRAASLALAAVSSVALAACGDGPGPGDTCAAGLLPGDLVITEVLANPSGSDGGNEWFEVYNASSQTIALDGLQITESDESGGSASDHTLQTMLSIAPGEYVVLGDAIDEARPAHVDLGYADGLGDFSNTAGRVGVRCGSVLLDTVTYLGTTDGVALGFDGGQTPSAVANEVRANWCPATMEYAAGDFGSPGEPNEPCEAAVTTCADAGVDRDIVSPDVGGLVISEVHANPSAVSDDLGEYVELIATAEFDLNGVTIGRAQGVPAGTFSSDDCISVSSGDILLVAANGDTLMNGGLPDVDLVADVSLSNTSANGFTVFVERGDTVIDSFTYNSSSAGASLQLDTRNLNSVDNDDLNVWCTAETPYGDGDEGSPGAPNVQCVIPPPPGMCEDGGTLRATVPPVAGDVVITEIMADSSAVGSDSLGEWFEVYFASDADLNALQLGRTPGTVETTINPPECLRVTGGTYVVFAATADMTMNGGLPATALDYDFALPNSSSESPISSLFVGIGDVVLDETSYSVVTSGVSRSLSLSSLDATDNDTESNWCDTDSSVTYGAGDAGSPGTANATCGACFDQSNGGVARAVVPPTPGDLVITEFLVDSTNPTSDTLGEWFEVLVNADVDLNGLEIGSPSGDVDATVGGTDCVRVTTGSYVVFARNADMTMNGGLPTGVIVYDGASLPASGDNRSLSIGLGGTVLDEVSYTMQTAGATRSLSPGNDETTNDTETNWCDATGSYGDGNLGSPGAENPVCPVVAPAGSCFDQDNGGALRAIVPPVLGDVVITEFLVDSTNPTSDTLGEWFEVTFAEAADLNELVIGSPAGDSDHVIGAGGDCISVAMGERVVFARNTDSSMNGGLPVGVVPYDVVALPASGSNRSLSIGTAATILDEVSYTMQSAGATRQLSPGVDATGNDNEDNWCDGTDVYGDGNLGTPGGANNTCPVVVPPGSCIDQDNGGTVRPIVSPAVTEAIITELMPNPSNNASTNANGEWVEVLFTTAVDLNGLTFSRVVGGSESTLTSLDCLPVMAGTHVVFARTDVSDDNGGIPTANLVITGFPGLTDGGSNLRLSIDGTTLDDMVWTISTDGVSRSLDPLSTDNVNNDVESNWCNTPSTGPGNNTYGEGDTGTPGMANPSCI